MTAKQKTLTVVITLAMASVVALVVYWGLSSLLNEQWQLWLGAFAAAIFAVFATLASISQFTGYTLRDLFSVQQSQESDPKRSSLNLLPGRATREPSVGHEMAFPFPMIESRPYQIMGWKKRHHGVESPRVPNVSCGLYLANETSGVGRYVQLVIRIRSTPSPEGCEFVHSGYQLRKARESGEWDEKNRCFLFSIRFSEKLVVYETPMLVGGLFITWEKRIATDDLPQEVTLEYDTRTLDAASHGRLELEIVEWK